MVDSMSTSGLHVRRNPCGYSFTPPLIISLIKYFLPSKNKTTIGRQQITQYALSSPHIMTSLYPAFKYAKPTGKVRIESDVTTIKGHINAFQVVINVKIPRVVIAGAARGRAVL